MSDYDLIVKDLVEIVGDQELREICEEDVLKVVWGTAPTGKIHIGYYLQMLKVAELVDAGCTVIILIADIHAQLDNRGISKMKVKNRSDYYIKTLKCMLEQLNVDLNEVKFVLGSSFQQTPEYIQDLFRISTICNFKTAKQAATEVVKPSGNPTLSGLLYPVMQVLDEEYLEVDAQLGGIDQRKILAFAREYLPKLGYKQRINLLTPMVSGLRFSPRKENTSDISNKMSSSDEIHKISVHDTRAEIKSKISRAYCKTKNIDDNSVLDILEHFLFPILYYLEKDFVIFRREEKGGPLTYHSFVDVQEAYLEGSIKPKDLKAGVIHNIDVFVEQIRKVFISRDWAQILKHAYE